MKDFNNPSLHPGREKMNKFRLSFLVLILAGLISCDILDIIDRFVLENYRDNVWVSP
jgi:hypothetical protein